MSYVESRVSEAGVLWATLGLLGVRCQRRRPGSSGVTCAGWFEWHGLRTVIAIESGPSPGW